MSNAAGAVPAVASAPVSGAHRALGVAGALVAVAGHSFLRALEDQLGRLGSPGAQPAYRAFAHLHGPHPELALRTWAAGTSSLAEFHPVTPQVLIRIHAAVGLVVVLAAAATLVAAAQAVRNRATAHPPGITIRGTLAVAAGAAALAQLVESLCEAALATAVAEDRTGGDVGRYASWFDATAAVRAGGLGLAALLLLVMAVRTKMVRRGWRALLAAPASHKGALLASIVFAATLIDGDRGAQAEDLLRRELATGGLLSTWIPNGIALAVLLLLIDQVRRLDATPTPPRATLPGTRILLVAGAILGAGVVVRITAGGASLLVLAALVALYAVVVLVVERIRGGAGPSGEVGAPVAPTPATVTGRSVVLAVAAAVPPAGLAVLTGRLLAGEVSIQRSWVPLVVLEAILLLVAAGAVLLLSRDRPLVGGAVAGPVLAGAVLAAVAVVAATSWSDPELGSDVGRGLGTIAILLLALAIVPALGVLLRPAVRDLPRPTGLRLDARTPVVALAVTWFLLAGSIGGGLERPDGSPHLIRTVPRRADVPTGDCGGLDSAAARDVAAALAPTPADPDEPAGAAAARGRLCRWIVRNAGPGAPGDEGRAVPLLLVAASGGGVRAATWTATVLECLLLRGEGVTDRCGPSGPGEDAAGRDAWPLLFAAGGASGGSVGVASATAQRIAPLEDERAGADEDWLRRLATRDHVGPVLTRMALVEGPMGWSGWQPEIDRAEVLIDSWSEPYGPVDDDVCATPESGGGEAVAGRQLEEVGFITLAHDCPDQVPALLLNATVVATGQRFDGSALGPLQPPGRALGPDDHRSDDPVALTASLCPDDDVPFFDVAFASSRFPVVTPSGRFPGASRSECEAAVPAVDVVDGGYRENSGAGQVLDLVRALRPALEGYAEDRPDGFRPVVPLLVEIENGEGTGEADGARQGPTGAVAEAVGPDMAPRGEGADTRAWVAEPARVPLTAWNVHTRGDPEAKARETLREEVRAIEGGTVVRLALARHPGRALPLGWSMTDAIVDDMAAVMRLCPNQLALDAVWEAIDGPTARPASCRSRGRRPEGGRWL